MKNNYKKLFLMLAFVSTTAFSQQTVFIDFGGDGTPTATGNYNNTTCSSSQVFASPAGNLIDVAGTSTSFSMSIHDPFIDKNTNGAQSPTGAAAIFDAQATSDSFFTSINHGGINNPTGGVTFTGLNDAKYYTFEVFASREDATLIREAQYTATGTNTVVGTLNCSSNVSNTVVLANVSPTGGTITFELTHGSGNNHAGKYAYLGAIKMTETTTLATNKNIFADKSITVYPNPVSNELNIAYILDNASKSSISIYDMSGKVIFQDHNGLNQAGTYSYKWNRNDNSGARVATGIYMLQMTADGKTVTKKLILD